jgi:hypothetical protein
MGNPALSAAEFSGRQTFHQGGPDREGHDFAAVDLPLPFGLRVPPMVEEVPGAPLVKDIEQRATGDQKDHQDNIRLHDGGWDGCRQFGERICEHGRRAPD